MSVKIGLMKIYRWKISTNTKSAKYIGNLSFCFDLHKKCIFISKLLIFELINYLKNKKHLIIVFQISLSIMFWVYLCWMVLIYFPLINKIIFHSKNDVFFNLKRRLRNFCTRKTFLIEKNTCLYIVFVLWY